MVHQRYDTSPDPGACRKLETATADHTAQPVPPPFDHSTYDPATTAFIAAIKTNLSLVGTHGPERPEFYLLDKITDNLKHITPETFRSFFGTLSPPEQIATLFILETALQTHPCDSRDAAEVFFNNRGLDPRPWLVVHTATQIWNRLFNGFSPEQGPLAIAPDATASLERNRQDNSLVFEEFEAWNHPLRISRNAIPTLSQLRDSAIEDPKYSEATSKYLLYLLHQVLTPITERSRQTSVLKPEKPTTRIEIPALLNKLDKTVSPNEWCQILKAAQTYSSWESSLNRETVSEIDRLEVKYNKKAAEEIKKFAETFANALKESKDPTLIKAAEAAITGKLDSFELGPVGPEYYKNSDLYDALDQVLESLSALRDGIFSEVNALPYIGVSLRGDSALSEACVAEYDATEVAAAEITLQKFGQHLCEYHQQFTRNILKLVDKHNALVRGSEQTTDISDTATTLTPAAAGAIPRLCPEDWSATTRWAYLTALSDPGIRKQIEDEFYISLSEVPLRAQLQFMALLSDPETDRWGLTRLLADRPISRNAILSAFIGCISDKATANSIIEVATKLSDEQAAGYFTQYNCISHCVFEVRKNLRSITASESGDYEVLCNAVDTVAIRANNELKRAQAQLSSAPENAQAIVQRMTELSDEALHFSAPYAAACRIKNKSGASTLLALPGIIITTCKAHEISPDDKARMVSISKENTSQYNQEGKPSAERSAQLQDYAHRSLCEALQADDSDFIILRHHSTILQYLRIEQQPRDDGSPPYIYIGSVNCDPLSKGLSIGGEFFAEILKRYKNSDIYLHVWEFGNAKSLYERQGFLPAPNKNISIGDTRLLSMHRPAGKK